jgi:hypothetical protein
VVASARTGADAIIYLVQGKVYKSQKKYSRLLQHTTQNSHRLKDTYFDMLRNTVLALLIAAEATHGQAAFTLRKTYDSSNFLDSFNFRDVRRISEKQ